MSEVKEHTHTEYTGRVESVNAVPDDWIKAELGDSCFVTKLAGYEYTQHFDYSIGGEIIAVRVLNLKKGRLNLTNVQRIPRRVSEGLPRSKLAKHDIVISYVGTVGEVALIDEDDKYHLAPNVAKISPDNTKIIGEYLIQVLTSDNTQKSIQLLGAVTSQPSLSMGNLRKVFIPSPPLPEQQKIAKILTSVDEVIEKTQAQIDKLKDLKTGMMQELLTKGIGHTEFKDSPVGTIPFGWEVKSLGDLASFVTSGSRGWAQYYSDSGAIFIRIGNLTREHINFRFKDTIYVTPPNSAEGKRTLVQTGDVLLSITADLGIIAVVNDKIGEAYVNQHVSLVRLNDPKISRWVGHFLAFEDSQKQFTANNDAGAKAGLNLTAIRNTQVALPQSVEMQEIVDSLDSLDSAIALKREKIEKVSNTKKALMQDLLTGKVRVNTAQTNTEVAVG
jgi:type I restriction enzyme S subunit